MDHAAEADRLLALPLPTPLEIARAGAHATRALTQAINEMTRQCDDQTPDAPPAAVGRLLSLTPRP